MTSIQTDLSATGFPTADALVSAAISDKQPIVAMFPCDLEVVAAPSPAAKHAPKHQFVRLCVAACIFALPILYFVYPSIRDTSTNPSVAVNLIVAYITSVVVVFISGGILAFIASNLFGVIGILSYAGLFVLGRHPRPGALVLTSDTTYLIDDVEYLRSSKTHHYNTLFSIPNAEMTFGVFNEVSDIRAQLITADGYEFCLRPKTPFDLMKPYTKYYTTGVVSYPDAVDLIVKAAADAKLKTTPPPEDRSA